MIIVTVATTPKTSGVSKRANTMVVIGAMSFDEISVNEDHIVALITFLFSSDMFIV